MLRPSIGSRGPYPYDEGRHLVVVLREWVYADESGIHDGAPFCLVAGYRGSPSQWRRFNRHWNAVLAKPEYNITGGFHSNVFFHRKRITDPKKNPYVGWTDQKAKRFIGELLQVIRRQKIRPVGCAVNVPDFESFSYGERCVLAGYKPRPSPRRKHRERPHPYHTAFRFMATDAFVDAAPDTELHFVLARQNELQQRALECYNLLKRLGFEGKAHQLKGLSFEEPEDVPGLQAADLFVYQWYGVLSRKGEVSAESRAIMNQLTHLRNDMRNCTANNIETMFREVGISDKDRAALQSIKGPS